MRLNVQLRRLIFSLVLMLFQDGLSNVSFHLWNLKRWPQATGMVTEYANKDIKEKWKKNQNGHSCLMYTWNSPSDHHIELVEPHQNLMSKAPDSKNDIERLIWGLERWFYVVLHDILSDWIDVCMDKRLPIQKPREREGNPFGVQNSAVYWCQ